MIHPLYVFTLKKFLLLLLYFLLYNIVLVLPYVNMHPPRVYTCSPSWTPLPLPSPYHPSGSSQCTSPKLPVSCIEPGLLQTMLSWTFVYKFLYEHMFSLLLCVYLALEFLANMVTVSIRFWGIPTLFSNVTVPVCNASSIRGSGYPHPCQGLSLSALILAVLVGANCYLLGVLICAP